ncbi:terminase large subunit [Salinicola sp. V024]|uniref:terminase large subunit n=1 Tax=Salinicola sp. V024 TaxID=3459609 RepID=UPI0040446281
MATRSTNSYKNINVEHRAHQYAVDVHSKKIIAGPDIRAACKRHLDDLKKSDERGIYYDEDSAERCFRFFENVLKLSGGEFEAQPFKLLNWQCFILGNLFGWKLKDKNTRRYKRAYVETGKGSGKSPLSGGIGLYGLIADGEGSPEIYAAASKKDQAQVLYRDAVSMVRQSPSLLSKITMSGRNPVWNMTYTGPKIGTGFFKPISSENGQSGPRPHIALIDELHEHKNNDIVEMMIAGTKGRSQPLIFMITNSGYDRNSVCFHYHEYARKVAKQSVSDLHFFSFICSLDKGDDPLNDETCWQKSNPSLGHTIKYEYLREQVEQAKGMPSKESIVLRLNFCVWTDAADPWITTEKLDSVFKDFDIEELRGQRCYAGLDLSSTNDLTALSLYFPDSKRLFCEFWTPGDTILDRARRDNVPYDLWRNQKHLWAPSGAVIDYHDVALRIAELQQMFDLRMIAFDPWKIERLAKELDKISCEILLTEHAQGFKRSSKNGSWMPHSLEILEKDIIENKIEFKKNPVLFWCSTNAVTESDRNSNRSFEKRKATGRIDGIVAAAMARGIAELDIEYEDTITESSFYFF